MGKSGLKLSRIGINIKGNGQEWAENKWEWAKKSGNRQQWAENGLEWVGFDGSQQEWVEVNGGGWQWVGARFSTTQITKCKKDFLKGLHCKLISESLYDQGSKNKLL